MPTAKHRVSLSLPENEYTELSAVAKQARVSMAWLARQALIEFLDRYRGKQPPSPVTVRKIQRAGR
jgi:metal-responsive CopG/Arc/MetJ family transcriptional regulator